MAQRYIVPTVQEFDDAGEPLAGAKLNFYSTGTTSRKDTFSDAALTTANANPVVADSAGRFGNIFLESGTYRVILTNSADVTIWDRDPVEGAVGASGAVDEITSAYTVAVDDATKVLAVDATSGAVTITLLAAAAAGDGFEITIKKTDSSVNAVTIDGNGAETIDGAATQILTDQYQSLTLRCDGAGWQITAREGIARDQVVARSLADSAFGFNLLNGTITTAVASNALTIAIKTKAGTDPTAADPVHVLFRNVTPATGDYTVLSLTAATSLVISSGSTLAATSATAFRVWLVGFNDGGTFRLGAINCLSGTNIYPLGQFPIASSTAEGGAGAADSAQVFYTGSAVTSKAYTILGYAEWASGLTTAGTWDAQPTRLHLFDSHTPLPGAVIQTAASVDGASATGTNTIPGDDTTPQNTEGTQFMSLSITPVAAANVLEIRSLANLGSGSGMQVAAALFKDSDADAIATAIGGVAASVGDQMSIDVDRLAGGTSAQTYKYRAGAMTPGSGTFNFNGVGSARFNGTLASHIRIKEVMG